MAGRSFASKVVPTTADFARIRSLPRRVLTRADADRYAASWTERLALKDDVSLLRWQGAALQDRTPTGEFLFMPVGHGKTLVCETLPVVYEAERAVLIAPASLHTKTYKARRSYTGVWKTAAPPPYLLSRHDLQAASGLDLLEKRKPDLIIIDEADEFANFDASATNRIHRYVMARRAAKKRCAVVVLTGTPIRRTLMGVWHLLVWALGDMAPVPLRRDEAKIWASAIDDAPPREGWRPDPGPLGTTIDKARAWFAKRLAETPGVILVDEDSAKGVPLRIRTKLAPPCPKIEKAFKRLRTKWKSPSGEEATDPLSLLRLEGQLGSGVFSYWDPPPSPEWREAYQEKGAFVRGVIQSSRRSRRPLDTEAMVLAAYKDAEVVKAWHAIRPEFDPRKSERFDWISDRTLRWAADWLMRGDSPSVLWTGIVPFGEALAEYLGVPYFGRGGKTRSGVELACVTPKKHPRFVASYHANMRGFDLQPWRRQGIIQAPQSAKWLEQIMGRAHRTGQTEQVTLWLLATSIGSLESFRTAIGEGRFANATFKHAHKLLSATIDAAPKTPAGTYRWLEGIEEP